MQRRVPVRLPGAIADWRIGGALAALALAALTAALAPLMDEDEIVVVAMLFLLVVLLTSALWGYGAGLVTALVADALLNFFFVPPLHTLTVQDPRNIAALGIFFAVAGVGASMLAILRNQLAVTEARRAELAVLLGLSRELAAASTPERALDVLARTVARSLGAERCDIVQREGATWRPLASNAQLVPLTRDEAALAAAALDSGKTTRRMAVGTRQVVRRTGHHSSDAFVPFSSSGGEVGVLHIVGDTGAGGADEPGLLRAFADETAIALERARLFARARETEAIRRSDEFKSVLLSSVSHDLRSPLTAIKAAVGSLRTEGITWEERDRAQLLELIESQTDRLTDTVSDLLDMSRLEGGAVTPAFESVDVTALLGDVAASTRTATAGRDVSIQAGVDLRVRADYGLLMRALTNLVENAAKYSTPRAPIHLRANGGGGRVLIEIADEGPGIAPKDLPHIFEKFYRGATGKAVTGSGLGLAIVQAMVELCGGRVTVQSAPSGTTFGVSLPPGGAPR